jgi:hypothetical protein
MEITQVQELGLKKLMANIATFSNLYGSITNLMIMTNPSFSTSIFVKYDKQFGLVKDRRLEINIVEINDRGEIVVLNDVFKGIYERYTFLGECLPIEANELIVM